MQYKTRILNCIPSKGTERDWKIDHAVKAGQIKRTVPKKLPKKKDLREPWWDISDQENTGSCVGWAVVDSILRWYFVEAGQLSKNERLSVRFIWMASKEMDECEYYPSTFLETDGTSIKSALDIARRFGCVKESDLPFKPEQLFKGDAETFLGLASQFMIRNYFNLSNPLTKLQDWRTWIATAGPILTRLNVDETWYSLDQRVNPGTFDLDEYKPATAAGGHAVAIVGYDRGKFIIRNSWGTGWGDHGYGYASEKYAMDAFDEAYGITVWR